jgi:hypothetical protein
MPHDNSGSIEVLTIDAARFAELLAAHFEWLLVHGETGRAVALRSDEMEVYEDRGRKLFDYLDDAGSRTVRVEGITLDGADVLLEVRSRFGKEIELLRLVPRTSAKQLAANVELARLEKANEIGRMICAAFPGARLARVALNKDNGRLAQISVALPDKTGTVALADLTDRLPPEVILTSAATILRQQQERRRKPVLETWMIAEKKQAAALQKLIGLLNAKERNRFRVFEVSRKAEPPQLVERRSLNLSDLWREKPKKLNLPADVEPSETARRIIAFDPESIDVIFSKQGETLRYRGLAFARVRNLMGREKAWYGVERDRRVLTEETWPDFEAFVADLRAHRRADTENKRHELYRAAPEAWLESILRRNIKLLDANLVLSPIYNQFRAAADKIDLLAIRKDGRLVIVELKTSPDRETVFQAADYWRKIELQRRRGELQRMRAFGDREILDKPALVYVACPALSFHRDFALYASMLAKEIELWRFELREDWRDEIKVLARRDYPTR